MANTSPNQYFTRINRSYTVNLKHIDKIETDKIYIGNSEFSISKQVHDLLIGEVQKLLK